MTAHLKQRKEHDINISCTDSKNIWTRLGKNVAFSYLSIPPLPMASVTKGKDEMSHCTINTKYVLQAFLPDEIVFVERSVDN